MFAVENRRKIRKIRKLPIFYVDARGVPEVCGHDRNKSVFYALPLSKKLLFGGIFINTFDHYEQLNVNCLARQSTINRDNLRNVHVVLGENVN